MLESILAAVSLVLFGFLGYWMLNSDSRLDQLRVGKLMLWGHSGKILATWDSAASPTAGIHNANLPSWLGYSSVPCGFTDDADAPDFKWTSFSYLLQGTTTKMVVPAWLPLLTFAIMPGIWIYGMPSKPRQRREASENAKPATSY
jgi:hypothetical protein